MLFISQPAARPALIVYSTAFLFNTGSAPGKPTHTGQQLVFWSLPKAFLQAQNTLVSVFNSA